MGFYSPATLVEDAKRHGVAIRPVDVNASDWDYTLEHEDDRLVREDGDTIDARTAHDARTFRDARFAVRMGLRYAKGLAREEVAHVERVRGERAFESLQDFARRSALNERSMKRLAEAGAFESFEDNRRTALWDSLGFVRNRDDTLPLAVAEESPGFAPLDSFETITWDYRNSAHSPRGHPLAPLRPELTERGLPDAKTIAGMRNDARIRYAGIVICRQRPATAAGVVFMTLEDETGFVNLVVWESVFKKYDVLAKTTSFLGVTGKLQAQDGVVHLVAESLWRPRIALRPESARSRDFH